MKKDIILVSQSVNERWKKKKKKKKKLYNIRKIDSSR